MRAFYCKNVMEFELLDILQVANEHTPSTAEKTLYNLKTVEMS